MQPYIIGLFFALLLFGGYYSFIILPRQRAFRQHYKVVSSMKVGEEVVTYGGIIGTIKKIEPEEGLVTLEVAPNVTVRVLAMGINQIFDPEGIADSARRGAK